MKKVKAPKMIEGNGRYGSCFHVSILADMVRFQASAGDTVYITDIKDMRKLAKYFNKAADFLRNQK